METGETKGAPLYAKGLALGGSSLYVGLVLFASIVVWGSSGLAPNEAASFGASLSRNENMLVSGFGSMVFFGILSFPAFLLVRAYFRIAHWRRRAFHAGLAFLLPVLLVLLLGVGREALTTLPLLPSLLAKLASAVLMGVVHSGEWWGERVVETCFGVIGFWEVFCVGLFVTQIVHSMKYGSRAKPSTHGQDCDQTGTAGDGI